VDDQDKGEDPAGDTALDQMSFSCRPGAEAVVSLSSCPDDAGEAWRKQLLPLLERPGEDPALWPEWTLAYHVFTDGSAALVRRTQGETARAIVGSAQILSPVAVIGLRDWGRWTEAHLLDEPLPRVEPDEVDRLVVRANPALEAQNHVSYLSEILAVLIDKPEARLEIVRRFDILPTTVVWALRVALGPAATSDRTWSFSTFELRRPHDLDPEIIFVPRGRASVDRRRYRVDPGNQPPPPRFDEALGRVRLALFGESSPTQAGHETVQKKVVTLRKATSAHAVVAALEGLEAFTSNGEYRPVVRRELGLQGMGELVQKTEQVLDELLDRVATAVFGPHGVDLHDPATEDMAAAMIEHGTSDRFAVRLLERAEGSDHAGLAKALVRRCLSSATVPTRTRPSRGRQAAGLAVLVLALVIAALLGHFVWI
jgi:hypothetical protein